MIHKRVKGYCIFITCLQLILAIAAYIFYKLCNSRMGVMRHVVYQSQKWEDAINPQMITYMLSLFFLFVLFIGIIYGIKQKRTKTGIDGWILSALSAASILFNLLYNRQMIRIYYYGQVICLIISLLQLIKCLLRTKERLIT